MFELGKILRRNGKPHMTEGATSTEASTETGPLQNENYFPAREEGHIIYPPKTDPVPPLRARRAEKGQPSRKNKVGSVLVTADVYDDNCIVSSVAIPKKDITAYIRGKVEPVLGPDYYYGYVYSDGRLSFVATRSATHVTGGLSVFTPAFLAPGRYAYRRGTWFHLLETTMEDGTTDHVVYERPDGAIDLNDSQPLNRKDIPPTLFLRWSMKSTHIPVVMLTGAAFLISLVVCLGMSFRYNMAVKEAAALQPPPPPPKTVHLTPDFGNLVKKIGAVVDGKGAIKSMQANGDTILFSLTFKQENDARAFMAMVGPTATYDRGTVTIGVDPTTGNYKSTIPNATIPAPAPAPAYGGKP